MSDYTTFFDRETGKTKRVKTFQVGEGVWMTRNPFSGEVLKYKSGTPLNE